MRTFSLIALWILLMPILFGCQSVVDGGGDNEVTTSEPTPPSPEVPVSYQTPLRLGDRFFVTSALTNLFIPDSVMAGSETTERNAIVSDLSNLIQTQIEDFGGAQDVFTSFMLVTDTLERKSRATFASSNTALRSAFGLRAVYEVLKPRTNELALRNIIGQARGLTYNQVVLATLTAPSENELRNLVALALPDVEASASTLASLGALRDQVIATSTKPTDAAKALEAWRFVTIAIMSNMAWQIL